MQFARGIAFSVTAVITAAHPVIFSPLSKYTVAEGVLMVATFFVCGLVAAYSAYQAMRER